MAQRLWFNDFPLTSDKFHSQYLPTFVFQSWTFAFWIKYLCPAWHITAPTIWDPNWVPYRCQQIKYCNCYGGELVLLLSRIGIFSPGGWCWAAPLTMRHWSHVRVVTGHGEGKKWRDHCNNYSRASALSAKQPRGRSELSAQRLPEVHYLKMDEHCNDPIMSAVWPESDAVKTKHSIIPN